MLVRSKLQLSRPQAAIYRSDSRYRIVVAGRRFGKTVEGVAEVLRDLARPDARVGYMAPTLQMAKDLMWDPLIDMIPDSLIAHKDSTRMSLRLRSGARFRAFGEKYDRARGHGWTAFHFDEVQDIHPDAWSKVVRPALSDRKGHVTFRGTPKGRANILYDLYEQAATERDWQRFHFTTLEGGWVDSEEIEAARRTLDEKTFRQEYEASFETSGALVYYAFSERSIRPSTYRPERVTMMTWDFNRTDIKPMVCLVLQVTSGELGSDTAEYDVVREFVYPNTSTEEMCRAVDKWFAEVGQPFALYVTGDFAGRRRESSASQSDYEIITETFGNYDGYYRRNPVTQPTRAIEDRVAATNSLLRSADGTQRLWVDPSCRNLIEDLGRTEWKQSGTGLDAAGGHRTDETDALSYFAYNWHDVSVRRPTVSRRG